MFENDKQDIEASKLLTGMLFKAKRIYDNVVACFGLALRAMGISSKASFFNQVSSTH
jgi:hypothetical protein